MAIKLQQPGVNHLFAIPVRSGEPLCFALTQTQPDKPTGYNIGLRCRHVLNQHLDVVIVQFEIVLAEENQVTCGMLATQILGCGLTHVTWLSDVLDNRVAGRYLLGQRFRSIRAAIIYHDYLCNMFLADVGGKDPFKHIGPVISWNDNTDLDIRLHSEFPNSRSINGLKHFPQKPALQMGLGPVLFRPADRVQHSFHQERSGQPISQRTLCQSALVFPEKKAFASIKL
jgi:hypothetical protein